MLLHFRDIKKLSTTFLDHNCLQIRPLVVVMTYARCKLYPRLKMAGFRKFQQTSCITHKVFIAAEVCTPAMPFHTRLADDELLHDLGSPSAAPLFTK